MPSRPFSSASQRRAVAAVRVAFDSTSTRCWPAALTNAFSASRRSDSGFSVSLALPN